MGTLVTPLGKRQIKQKWVRLLSLLATLLLTGAAGLNQVFLSMHGERAAAWTRALLAQVNRDQSIGEAVDDLTGAQTQGRRGSLLEVAPAASTETTPLFLVQTVNTAVFSPSSPDPSGITYLPTTGLLWLSDGEVEEIPALFAGVNLFGVTLTGGLAETKTTLSFSSEPTDLTYNPHNGHIFYSDDVARKIFEVNPGGDGFHGTSDDQVTFFATIAFGCRDPEGVSYDAVSGDLFIADAVGAEVYRVHAGANGLFDGVPASGGDDSVTSFDTVLFNLSYPQGIHFDATSGNLILVGKNPKQIYEVTTEGNLVRTLQIAVPGIRSLAGVVMAPGSRNPAIRNYYVVDRGVDNDYDPDENDGKLYEFTIEQGVPTVTPLPTSTPFPTNTLLPTGLPTVSPTSTATRTPTLAPNPTETPVSSNMIYTQFLPLVHK